MDGPSALCKQEIKSCTSATNSRPAGPVKLTLLASQKSIPRHCCRPVTTAGCVKHTVILYPDRDGNTFYEYSVC